MNDIFTELARVEHAQRLAQAEHDRLGRRVRAMQRLERRALRLSRKSERTRRRAELAARRVRLALGRAI